MDDGKWVSLDEAIEWSVKRGSAESKKLSCDSKAEQEEISAYNKKMDKALRSYLIKVNNARGVNPKREEGGIVYGATKFTTTKAPENQ